MKTQLVTLCILFVGMISMNAQDRTTVTANSIDISDNLDLRAIAHIFGESSNLEDFERRLNNPETPISNLDLNNDNQVDYLRVIESVENRTHLIIVQSVIGRDLFQDVATIEVEKDNNNQVQVQIVGDVFMYGPNYIYEPIYVHRPILFNTFWVGTYRPYYSPWYWGYYPTHFYAWNPYPIFRYRNHVNVFINVNNTCHYVSHRRSHRAVAMHHSRRANGYERQYPNRSFSSRNAGISNRYELAQTRQTSSNNRQSLQANSVRSVRNTSATGTRSTTNNDAALYTGTRGNQNTATRNPSSVSTPRTNTNGGVRSKDMAINTPRSNSMSNSSSSNSTPRTRNNSSVGFESNSSVSTPRVNSTPRATSMNTPKVNSTPRSSSNQVSTPRSSSSSMSAPKSTPRSSSMSTPRSSSPRSSSMSAPKSSNRSSSMSAPRSAPRAESSSRSSGSSQRRG